MSLMLHCGANAVDRNTLATLPVPNARGRMHVTRPFIEDVDLISGFMQSIGLHIQDEGFGITYDERQNPKRFFGLMKVSLSDHESDYGLTVGLRGSYDQSLPRGLAVGSHVFVCDNLAFSGEITIKTKQTTNVGRRLPAMLEHAVSQIPTMAMLQDKRFEAYRNTCLSHERGDQLLIELVRQQALMPSQLGRALAEWDTPSHEEHAQEGATIWQLHNAVTEAIKPSNVERSVIPQAWDRTRTMTRLFDHETGMEVHQDVEVA